MGCSRNRWLSNRTSINSAGTVQPAVSVSAIVSGWQHVHNQPATSVYKLELERAQQGDHKGLPSTCLRYIRQPLGSPFSSPLSWTLGLVHKVSRGNKKEKQSQPLAEKGHLNEKHPAIEKQNRGGGNEKDRKPPNKASHVLQAVELFELYKTGLYTFFFLLFKSEMFSINMQRTQTRLSDASFHSKAYCYAGHKSYEWNFVTCLSHIVTAFSIPTIPFMYYKITKGYANSRN